MPTLALYHGFYDIAILCEYYLNTNEVYKIIFFLKKVLKRKTNYANIYLACEKYANRGVAQLVEYVVWDHGAGGSSPLTPTNAGVAELADALDLGSSVFDVGVQVLSPAP